MITSIQRIRHAALLPIFLGFAAALPLSAQDGTLVGRVTDASNARPVTSAQVFVTDGDGTLTNLQGQYILRGLAEGVYELRVQSIGYRTKTITGVTVTAGEISQLDVTLESSAIEVQGITVSATAERGTTTSLLTERARASVVSDAIGADQMSRSPDGDAAAALARVPGLSVVDGKFAYVRGLGERYSSTTLNGSPLASPVPDQKVIPLDLFPSNFLESIVTSKSFSPDQPGDYAGGLVQLRTKSFPARRTLSFSLSGGWNSVSTFQDGFGYAGGSRDFFGYDDGSRALPARIPRDRPLNSLAFATGDLYDIGRSIGGDWGPTPESNLPPNFSAGLSYGDDIDLGNDRRLGFILSGNFANSTELQTDVVERVFASAGVEDPEVDYTGSSTRREATVGAMLNAAVQLSPTQQLRFSSLYNHIAEDQARILTGFNLDSNTDQRNTRISFLEQSVVNGQLEGEHGLSFLGDATLEWRGGFSRAVRYEPNTRDVLYRRTPGGVFVFDNFVQSGSIFHQNLVDDALTGAVDLDLPFELFDRDALVAIGGSWNERDRDVYTRRFRYIPSPGAELSDEFRAQEPNELFDAQNIGPAGFIITEATFRADNYDASEAIGGAYLKVDIRPIEKLTASGGVRFESTEQIATPQDFYETGQPALPGADQSVTDILPALNLTYALGDRINLRASGSRTLARPQLRELAPFSFADYAGGFLVSGNPQLERSTIDNLDLRWEFFPTPSSVISVSGFYKRFTSPIEVLVLPSSELIKSWVNAESAVNYGTEIELRSGLGFLGLPEFSFNGNLTLVESEVQTGSTAAIYIPGVGPTDIEVVDRTRALQGQSPYVANLGLTWFDPETERSATVLFNRFGERIDAVGGQGTPDIFEAARSQLDVTVQTPLGAGWEMKFSATRLLGSETRFTQGGGLLRGWNRGRTVSLGLSWTN